MMRLLVDRNVEQLAVRAEPAVTSQPSSWGPISVHGYRGQTLPAGWLLRQVEALPTIGRLAREGTLTLCTSSELRFESLRAAPGFRGYVGDVFKDVPFTTVPAAIERSYFSSTVDLKTHASGIAQADWYESFLLRVDERILLKAIDDGFLHVPDFMRGNIETLARFRELCVGLNSGQIRDAFHLWTAEANRLDYFLTADGKFLNVMTRTKQIELPTPPIDPRTLVEKLGIPTLDPLPIADQRFRYLFEADAE